MLRGIERPHPKSPLEKLLEIYFQNPQFGYYFLVLTSQRLLENIARLEGIIAQNKLAQPAPN